MPNPLKYLLGNFERSYGQAANDFQQQQQSEAILNRQIALQNYKDQIEQNKKRDEEQNRNALIEPLITNKISELGLTRTPSDIEKTGLPFNLRNMENQYRITEPRLKPTERVRELTPEERTSRLLQLDTKGIERYKSLKSLTGEDEAYNKIGNLLGLTSKDGERQTLPPEVREKAERTLSASKMLGVKPAEAYKQLEAIVNPKIKTTVEKPYSRVHIYESGAQKEVPIEGGGLNPSYKLQYKDWEIPGSIHKDKSGRFVKDVGLYDPYADVWDNDGKGNRSVKATKPIKITTRGTNNEKIFSKKVNEHFGEYSKSINVLQTELSKENPSWTPQEIANKIFNISNDYSNEVKNTASKEFRGWYKSQWESTDNNKKAKSNPAPLVFWNNLMGEYRKGNLSVKDLQSGYHLFRSTYLQDPLKLYGYQGLDQYFESEDDDITNEEENDD